jgi:RNA polymerase sigma-70 factor (ECF subfamily)
MTSLDDALTGAFQREWGQIVATLIGLTGDWDLAEECAQESFARAAQRWPTEGIPARPGAWLTTVARNHARNRLSRAANESIKLQEAASMAPSPDLHGERHDDGEIEDDRLRLIFTCCHPALPIEGRVALTLRTLAGLTTPEIARAMLVPEATLAQRLVRAKRKIKHAAIPYRVPPAHLLTERTDAVLKVVYLLFNEGYAATAGADLIRTELTAEAIRLARLLARLLPGDPEVHALLALMLLHDARAAARTDAHGDLIPLEEQDRARWDRARIAEGRAALGTAVRLGEVGIYTLQAAIVEQHAIAPTPGATDWPHIVSLYDLLLRAIPSPIVALNRAIAVAMADGPEAGLRLIGAIEADGGLAGYPLLPASRADLLRRLGRADEASASYRRALALTASEPERRYLGRRLAELDVGTPGD